MSEKNFNNLEQVGYAGDSIDISSLCPYQFVSDAYHGTNGFRDGRYISKYQREMSYDNRRKQAYYKNFVKGIVDAVIIPVFSDAVFRVCDSDLFTAFIKNCDNAGMKLQNMTKSATKYARLHGVSFLVMDNFPADQLVGSQAEIIASRKFPYIYLQKASTVKNYKTDTFGNLEEIVFYDRTQKDDKKQTSEKLYRKWTKEYSVTVKIEDKGKQQEVGEKSVHGLGVVPVIEVRSTDTEGFLPSPPYYDICRLNWAIYNQDSEQRNIERQQAFSLLVMPGEESNSNAEVGANSVLWIGSDATQSPSFISPDAGILTTLRDSSSENVNNLLAQANVLGATAVVKGGGSDTSGVAHSYTFQGQNFALKETSQIANDTEMKVAELFKKYVPSEDFEYTVEYPDDFAPTYEDVKTKMDFCDRIADRDISPAVTTKVNILMVKQLYELFQLPNDDYEDVEKDIIANGGGLTE